MTDFAKNPGGIIGRPIIDDEVILRPIDEVKKRVSIGAVKNETFNDFFGKDAKDISLKYSEKRRKYLGGK
jgi:hypothetical protein